MNVGSLFSGVGGMDAGLAAAGHRHVFFCESDPYRRDVLRARFPGVPVYDDVSTLRLEPAARAPRDGRVTLTDGAGRVHTIAVPDLLCGGFPCQDLSVAGRRAGLAGDRSGLFFEFARIAESLRPRWLLIENVPGLLSSQSGRDFGCVLGTLADLGYGVAWRILDSRFFGVPQRRRRVFIVGAKCVGDPRAAAERAGEVLAVGSRCPGHPPTGTQAGPEPAVASLSGLGSGGPDDNDGQGGRLVAETLREHPRPGSNSNGQIVSHALTSEGADASEDGTGRGTPVVAFHAAQDPISGHVSPAMGKEDSGSIAVSSAVGVRRLTPTECERLQALPDGWTQVGDTPDSKRYSALGDAVTASVAEWIGRRLPT